MEHGHNNPIIAIFLAIGSFFGLISLQSADILLGVILKAVSIISFAVAIGYTIYKWRAKIEMHRKTMDILNDKTKEKGHADKFKKD